MKQEVRESYKSICSHEIFRLESQTKGSLDSSDKVQILSRYLSELRGWFFKPNQIQYTTVHLLKTENLFENISYNGIHTKHLATNLS